VCSGNWSSEDVFSKGPDLIIQTEWFHPSSAQPRRQLTFLGHRRPHRWNAQNFHESFELRNRAFDAIPSDVFIAAKAFTKSSPSLSAAAAGDITEFTGGCH